MNPEIIRIRTDVTWEDVIASYSSEKKYINGMKKRRREGGRRQEGEGQGETKRIAKICRAELKHPSFTSAFPDTSKTISQFFGAFGEVKSAHHAQTTHRPRTRTTRTHTTHTPTQVKQAHAHTYHSASTRHAHAYLHVLEPIIIHICKRTHGTLTRT